ncbi:glycosyltransferase [Sphingomonas sp.]|uniref:glycosyltransferase n=1 Tax=Sphingomonas sp. TaxID=28214 RepID=UPI001AFFA67D|nr:glycosyltransferase [Sphingomonas sp.]MBO9713559.1 glycosyltransferase [Sphingomonas sp.]
MLRVLTLSTLFPAATMPNFGIFVERQALALAKRDDVELRVVAPRGLPPWPLSRHSRYRPLVDLPERESWKGLEVYRPAFLNIPGSGGRHHAAMLVRALEPLLCRIRDDFPFDLLAAEFFFPDGPAAAELGRRLGVPVSITARGSDIHYWTAQAAVRPQIVAAGQSAARLVAVSDALRDDMAALGMPRDRIDSIMTGIDLDRFNPRIRFSALREYSHSGQLVASIGALIPLKGHEIVIRAVAALPGVKLWILGDGPERAALGVLIASLGVADRIKLWGPVSAEEVAMVAALADVMALASEREGMANAWVEALASGTPIVIPDVGGARQLLEGKPQAGTIAARTPEAFTRAITALLAAPPDRAAVRATVDGFGWEANAAALVSHYRSAIDASAGMANLHKFA